MGLKESEIRPERVFKKYISLAEKDCSLFFTKVSLVEINCPACGRIGRSLFTKQGFGYSRCDYCETLFQTPRAPISAFEDFYKKSESAEYWANEFYPLTAESRRKTIWEPKARSIYAKVSGHFHFKPHQLIDIGGGFGIFAEEYVRVSRCQVPIIIEPNPTMASICRSKGFSVIESFFGADLLELSTVPRLFTSFELIEHLHHPESFFSDVLSSLGKDDLFIFTTLSGTGLDIQLLGEQSRAVTPPQHLNFFNPGSITLLLEKLGFFVHDVSTPGLLDFDILRKQSNCIKDKLWRKMVDSANESDLDLLQSIISRNKMSSHMMVVCGRKR